MSSLARPPRHATRTTHGKVRVRRAAQDVVADLKLSVLPQRRGQHRDRPRVGRAGGEERLRLAVGHGKIPGGEAPHEAGAAVKGVEAQGGLVAGRCRVLPRRGEGLHVMRQCEHEEGTVVAAVVQSHGLGGSGGTQTSRIGVRHCCFSRLPSIVTNRGHVPIKHNLRLAPLIFLLRRLLFTITTLASLLWKLHPDRRAPRILRLCITK